ncbi:RidA family protein [Rhodobacterales bacterium HKCCE2091]|nr:RidA family protein [Rhodobacterales bacterium HKCCE2091]
MSGKRISSGSPFEAAIGYSRAVVEDGWVFVAGTTGFDYATLRIADDVVEQCEQAFRNIEKALGDAGASLRDVVRVTYILPDGADWEACWPVTAKWLGAAMPAATMISAGLQDPRMRIEIEVTARLPD